MELIAAAHGCSGSCGTPAEHLRNTCGRPAEDLRSTCGTPADHLDPNILGSGSCSARKTESTALKRHVTWTQSTPPNEPCHAVMIPIDEISYSHAALLSRGSGPADPSPGEKGSPFSLWPPPPPPPPAPSGSRLPTPTWPRCVVP